MFIYALVDPNSGEIRYIGQTSNLYKRLGSHVSSVGFASQEGSPFVEWMRSLVMNAQCPIVKVLERCSPEVANARERFWVERLETETQLLNRYLTTAR